MIATAAGHAELLIANLAFGGILAVLLIAWVRSAPLTPDPWDAETDKKLSEPEIEQTCTYCSTPQKNDAWFCPHCGSAVGPYNNMMPYLWIFSQGEVLRNGADGKVRLGPVTVIGYLLYAFQSYVFLAPVYLFRLFKNLARLEEEKTEEPPPGVK